MLSIVILFLFIALIAVPTLMAINRFFDGINNLAQKHIDEKEKQANELAKWRIAEEEKRARRPAFNPSMQGYKNHIGNHECAPDLFDLPIGGPFADISYIGTTLHMDD